MARERWIGPIVTCALIGCGASHAAEPTAGGFVSSADDGAVEIRWSIPDAQQPPRPEGAAEVLTAAALAAFHVRVGQLLAGTPALYEGTLLADGGETLDSVLQTSVMVTATTMPNLYFHDRSFGPVHLLKAYAGDTAARATIVQDASEAELSADWLSPDGLGSAWIDVSSPLAGDSRATLWGRCLECMTVLRGSSTESVVLRGSALDPDDGPPVAVVVQGALARITPEALDPERLARYWLALGDAAGSALAAEFRETAPRRWERAHADRTYLRCKEGGSRLVDYRTTWRLQVGDPALSGIGAIEVLAAAPCENFDYGGGS
jgi:hypothetical protein